MTLTTELAHRQGDGLEVTLLWEAVSNRIWIELLDERDDNALRFGVDPASALDAFYHPYAYAAREMPMYLDGPFALSPAAVAQGDRT